LISPKDLAALIQTDKSVKLVDVRSREEFEGGQYRGFHFAVAAGDATVMASGSNTHPIVVIDHAGKNGLDAAAYFMGMVCRTCAACAAALTPGRRMWSRRCGGINSDKFAGVEVTRLKSKLETPHVDSYMNTTR